MKLQAHALFTLLAFTLSILLTGVQSQYVPGTCQCPQVKKRVQGPFSDFKVTLKGPTCSKDEIIVTQQKNKNPVCLSPEHKQGKILLKCWQRMQSDGKDSKKCIQRQKPQTSQRKREQGKSKKVTS
ncbi:C-X-C motif chemokine 9 [Myxocyprinus asiaticus]|uniref:C-X-C motif chemokine 9 n=1 Tax=Myxocyprinus asiaticus TaxID=70543 RepID=UPI002223E2BC|nr:C-X-C motif chemokine 9 [Myxocyprinus asiaticus]